MKVTHPTEEEIQAYSLNTNCDTVISKHIAECKSCRLKATQYKAMFTAIKQEPYPSFEFNLTKLVMEQLPVTKPTYSFGNFFMYLLLSLIILIISTLLYPIKSFFITSIVNITSSLFSIITCIALLLSMFFYVEMYKKFKAKINIIHFS
jgi:hypothetical protein